MAEYSSLKVPELKKLLAERGLAQTGNKADLIARLNENDNGGGGEVTKAETAHTEAVTAQSAETKEDEITYSDDEAPAAKPAPAEAQAASAAQAAPAQAAPAQADAAQNSAPADSEPAAAAEGAAPAQEEEKPAVSYAMGLSSTAADDEAKKRADRAKRFGIEEDDDSKKKADRAQRFGLDQKELASGLDSALPERPLKRGRGRAGEDSAGGRPGKRQSLDRRGGGGNGGGQGRRRGGRREGGGGGGGRDAQPAKRAGIMDDPAEKAKAEKRAARFAAA